MKKLQFKKGMALGENELKTEQSYSETLRRFHNYYLHGWGIATGLQANRGEENTEVKVSPGMVVFRSSHDSGMEIGKEGLLFEEKRIDLKEYLPVSINTTKHVYLFVKLLESSSIGLAGDSPQNMGSNIYTSEELQIFVSETKPANEGLDLIIAKVDLQYRGSADPISNLGGEELRKYISNQPLVESSFHINELKFPGAGTFLDRLKEKFTQTQPKWPDLDGDGKVESKFLLSSIMNRLNADVIPASGNKSVQDWLAVIGNLNENRFESDQQKTIYSNLKYFFDDSWPKNSGIFNITELLEGLFLNLDANKIPYDSTNSIFEKIGSLANSSNISNEIEQLLFNNSAFDVKDRIAALENYLTSGGPGSYARKLPIVNDLINLVLFFGNLFFELLSIEKSPGFKDGYFGKGPYIDFNHSLNPLGTGIFKWKTQRKAMDVVYLLEHSLVGFVKEKKKVSFDILPKVNLFAGENYSNDQALRYFILDNVYCKFFDITDRKNAHFDFRMIKVIGFEFLEYFLDNFFQYLGKNSDLPACNYPEFDFSQTDVSSSFNIFPLFSKLLNFTNLGLGSVNWRFLVNNAAQINLDMQKRHCLTGVVSSPGKEGYWVCNSNASISYFPLNEVITQLHLYNNLPDVMLDQASYKQNIPVWSGPKVTIAFSLGTILETATCQLGTMILVSFTDPKSLQLLWTVIIIPDGKAVQSAYTIDVSVVTSIPSEFLYYTFDKIPFLLNHTYVAAPIVYFPPASISTDGFFLKLDTAGSNFGLTTPITPEKLKTDMNVNIQGLMEALPLFFSLSVNNSDDYIMACDFGACDKSYTYLPVVPAGISFPKTFAIGRSKETPDKEWHNSQNIEWLAHFELTGSSSIVGVSKDQLVINMQYTTTSGYSINSFTFIPVVNLMDASIAGWTHQNQTVIQRIEYNAQVKTNVSGKYENIDTLISRDTVFMQQRDAMRIFSDRDNSFTFVEDRNKNILIFKNVSKSGFPEFAGVLNSGTYVDAHYDVQKNVDLKTGETSLVVGKYQAGTGIIEFLEYPLAQL